MRKHDLELRDLKQRLGLANRMITKMKNPADLKNMQIVIQGIKILIEQRRKELKRLHKMQYREKHPEYKQKRRNTQKALLERKKREFYELKGNKCEVCGETDWVVLEIHHTEGREYQKDYLKNNFDISKVKLLCANCHRREHYRIGGSKKYTKPTVNTDK